MFPCPPPFFFFQFGGCWVTTYCDWIRTLCLSLQGIFQAGFVGFFPFGPVFQASFFSGCLVGFKMVCKDVPSNYVILDALSLKHPSGTDPWAFPIVASDLRNSDDPGRLYSTFPPFVLLFFFLTEYTANNSHLRMQGSVTFGSESFGWFFGSHGTQSLRTFRPLR